MQLRYYPILLLLLLLLSCGGAKQPPIQQSGLQEFNLMTYNIKNDYDKEGLNNWLSRRQALSEMIADYEPHFLGVQEALINQVHYLDEQLENHRFIGKSRDGEGSEGEFCTLFYDHRRFELLKEETFWLSETPSTPSKSWDAALPRIATMGVFKDRATGNDLVVYNTHFDHVGEQAREASSRVLLQHIQQQVDEAQAYVIVMGDLNAEPQSEPLRILSQKLEDSRGQVAEAEGPTGTYNAFDPNAPIERCIDYILVDGLKATSHEHIDRRLAGGGHLSDHLAVFARLQYADGE